MLAFLSIFYFISALYQNLSEFEKSISSNISVHKSGTVEFKLVREHIGTIEKILKVLRKVYRRGNKSKLSKSDNRVLRLHRYMVTGMYDTEEPILNRKTVSEHILPGKNITRGNLEDSRRGNVRDNRMRQDLADVRIGNLPGRNMARDNLKDARRCNGMDNGVGQNLTDVRAGNLPGRGNIVPRDDYMSDRCSNMPDRDNNMPNRDNNIQIFNTAAVDHDEGMKRFNIIDILE